MWCTFFRKIGGCIQNRFSHVPYNNQKSHVPPGGKVCTRGFGTPLEKACQRDLNTSKILAITSLNFAENFEMLVAVLCAFFNHVPYNFHNSKYPPGPKFGREGLEHRLKKLAKEALTFRKKMKFRKLFCLIFSKC